MKEPTLGPLGSIVGPIQSFWRNRRRIRVTVHRAFFEGGFGASPLTTPTDMLSSVPTTGTGPGVTAYYGRGGIPTTGAYYFVKVTNCSINRDITITHVWFEADPRVDLLNHVPATVRRDGGQWEDWIHTANLAHVRNVERAARVLTAGRKRPYKSRPAKNLPPRGRVAWPQSAP
jgi:hypothetical protein